MIASLHKKTTPAPLGGLRGLDWSGIGVYRYFGYKRGWGEVLGIGRGFEKNNFGTISIKSRGIC